MSEISRRINGQEPVINITGNIVVIFTRNEL